MDIESWLKLFQAAKNYGLNHIRFHSWCPPEAAFEAADQLGVYLQVESPMWMDTWNMAVGAHPEHYTYLPQEARRIAHVYGNHPSFCIYSNGNELNGDFDLLHWMVEDLKSFDDRRLYTLTTNWDRQLDAADDLFIAQSVDGIGVRGQYFPEELALSTQLDFRDAVANRPVPVISHEVGQYAVYPDVQEMEKYSGALRPVNLEVIQADMKKRGLLGNLRSFVHGSGMLALQLYRDEIEAALRTPSLGGFQLLDLHDFPGQSTATVGLLNAFWESKGLIEPQQFREFLRANGTAASHAETDLYEYRAVCGRDQHCSFWSKGTSAVLHSVDNCRWAGPHTRFRFSAYRYDSSWIRSTVRSLGIRRATSNTEER